MLVFATMAAGSIVAIPFAAGRANNEASPIFGVKIPPGYRDWRSPPNLSLPLPTRVPCLTWAGPSAGSTPLP
jgi:hypothetical protein